MIWYEVRAQVPHDLAEAYERYLRDHHIPDLLATGCFVEASFCRADAVGRTASDGATPPGVHFRSAYLAPHREALDDYLADHAARLRAHAMARFPEGLVFERETWEVRQRWGGGAG
jgi:hypothetical protein